MLTTVMRHIHLIEASPETIRNSFDSVVIWMKAFSRVKWTASSIKEISLDFIAAEQSSVRRRGSRSTTRYVPLAEFFVSKKTKMGLDTLILS